MLTINSFFPVLMIGSKVLRVRKIYKDMHMPQFFQPTLLNSRFLYKRGALPCAGKHSCTSSKKNVLKSLFVLMPPCIVNKPVNCQYLYQRKEKRYFVGSFLNHMDPCAYLLKWSCYALHYTSWNHYLVSRHWQSLLVSCSQALYPCEAMHYQSCIECFVKISSQFVPTDHMRRCFHGLKKR